MCLLRCFNIRTKKECVIYNYDIHLFTKLVQTSMPTFQQRLPLLLLQLRALRVQPNSQANYALEMLQRNSIGV